VKEMIADGSLEAPEQKASQSDPSGVSESKGAA
jgi:hypothetical protein